MSYTVTQESFGSLASYWKSSPHRLNWPSVFVLPVWLEVWWREFQPVAELYISAVRQQSDIIGIAPLQVRGKKASIIGDTDVCDYVDFVVAPGRENDFFNVLLDDLGRKGIDCLDLEHVRADSIAVTHLVDVARNRGYEVSCRPDAVSLGIDLPSTWDEYLGMLNAKQRHEVKRKLRRLGEVGRVDYRTVEGRAVAEGVTDMFLKLFVKSREDKAAFMTEPVESFFRSMIRTMAEADLLRFGILELDTQPTAVVMCFDYNNTVYLYNSGYDPEYSALSAGLLSKVLCIKDSIERGRKRFDFLKGSEMYKYRLGGRETPLYRCRITIR